SERGAPVSRCSAAPVLTLVRGSDVGDDVAAFHPDDHEVAFAPAAQYVGRNGPERLPPAGHVGLEVASALVRDLHDAHGHVLALLAAAGVGAGRPARPARSARDLADVDVLDGGSFLAVPVFVDEPDVHGRSE